jgi:hypothetical protein
VQVVAAGIADAGVDRWTRAFAFFQLLLNLVLRLIACCALRKAVSCRLKLLSGA